MATECESFLLGVLAALVINQNNKFTSICRSLLFDLLAEAGRRFREAADGSHGGRGRQCAHQQHELHLRLHVSLFGDCDAVMYC